MKKYSDVLVKPEYIEHEYKYMTIISTSTSISKMYSSTEYFGPRSGLHVTDENVYYTPAAPICSK